MEFLKKYKVELTLSLIIILLLIGGILLFSNNYTLRGEEKRVKNLLDSLHRDNELLINELQINKDSIQILHSLAVNQNNRDTIFVNKIKYLKNQTNEEINSLYSLSVDSNLKLHAKLSSEFISGLSGKDSL